ncbi:MAG: DUF1499 domain-containing protein [Gammaproteobacteria bacterium]
MNRKSLISIAIIVMTLSTTQAAAAAEKKLPLCPNSPNCVSSQATDAGHVIAPFKFTVAAESAWEALKNALRSQTRTVITADTGESLHAEASSLIFRFVDDIDALLDREAQLIHIRSASRTGYYDLGVNRKRIEALRSEMRKAGAIE